MILGEKRRFSNKRGEIRTFSNELWRNKKV